MRVTRRLLDLGSFSVRVGNDVCCAAIDACGDFCSETPDPECIVGPIDVSMSCRSCDGFLTFGCPRLVG
jgi:hypothetical protein